MVILTGLLLSAYALLLLALRSARKATQKEIEIANHNAAEADDLRERLKVALGNVEFWAKKENDIRVKYEFLLDQVKKKAAQSKKAKKK